ncbi:PAAR domain-containing protein [Paraburkholderia oxyphila]|uniref:PAAR domain-containing protein n=1 Tax=Paraburkholderia oxyphila TaxID=614212 RepID=UPI000A040857|nr:PAAR domain-containing protein [Paraburkholderia oxyphila]
MRRYLLRPGDKSTAGGVVIEGVENRTHQGRPLTFIDAKVVCPVCNTTGVIGRRGPHRSATMMGKHQALEGDICICACDPPPVMIASQDTAWHEFTAREMGEAPGSSRSMTGANHDTHDELEHYFELLDAISGAPIDGMTYTLFSDGVALFNSELLASGKTAMVSKATHPDLTFIAWRTGSVR